MFKKGFAALLLAATTTAGIGFAAPAEARRGYDEYRGGGDYYRGSRYRGDRYDRYDRNYYRGYRGDDRRYRSRCKRDNGTGGTIIGAVAGGLIGREVGRNSGGRYGNGGGDGSTGAIIGAVVGGLAGGAIDRSDNC